jgi:hypothetical protein
MPTKNKQYEATEAKLFQNLETLINRVGTLGAAYQPPNPSAELATMQANLTGALALRTTLQQKEAVEEEKRNEREDLFEPVAGLCGDIAKYCESAGWDANDVANLRAFTREMRGKSAKPKKPAASPPGAGETPPTPPNTISSAQTSFASRAEHFSNFLETVRANAARYQPKETKFKLATLDARLAAMRDSNSAVNTAETDTNQARSAFDETLYTGGGNLVDAAKSAKKYLGALFKTHQVYQDVKNLTFTKPKRFQ